MQRDDSSCPGCGKAGPHGSYSGAEGRRMKETGECFTCAFWELRAVVKHPLVIDNCLYSVGPEPGEHTNRNDLGMSGRRFDVEMLDGRRFTTHNLWLGGEIPERFRDRIPNTAHFMSGAERCQVGETTCWNSSDDRAPAYPPYVSI